MEVHQVEHENDGLPTTLAKPICAGSVCMTGPATSATRPRRSAGGEARTLSAYRVPGLLCLLATSCAAIPPRQQPAELPPGVYGIYQDNDVGAINQSSWALAAPSRTLNNPVDATKAVLAVDYLADELPVNPRWLQISPITKQHMVEARSDTRRAVGIAPNAPSQLVADALLQTISGLQTSDRTTVMSALALPVFVRPPEQTLQVLTNLPYIRSANIATSEAAIQALSQGDMHRN
jgi:hypothetical protein